jgi:hypothetical protein
MLKQKIYSGIGSRRTLPEILELMTSIASFMEEQGYILHSGGADGADKAFESGVQDSGMKKIFLPWKGFNRNSSTLYVVSEKAVTLAKEFHPSWDTLSDAAKLLIARNGYQILGDSLNTPVDLIICYTPHGRAEGGTGQAIRIAQYYQIPVFNLYFKKDIEQILSWMNTKTICLKKEMELELWKLI